MGLYGMPDDPKTKRALAGLEETVLSMDERKRIEIETNILEDHLKNLEEKKPKSFFQKIKSFFTS